MSQMPPPLTPLRPEVLDYEQASRAKQSFSLYGWGWICYLAGVVVALGMAPLQGKLNDVERGAPYVVGELLGMLLVSIIPALIAFYIGRRSRTAATVTFVVVVALGVLGQFGDMMKYRRAQAAQVARTQLSAQVRQVQTVVSDQIESGKPVDFGRIDGAVDTMKDTARKTASALSPEEGAALRAMAGFLERLKGTMAPYQQAADAMREKTPLPPGWIKSKDDIGVARSSIAKFRQANAGVRSLFADWNKIFREELAKQKLSPAAQAQMMGRLATKLAQSQAQFYLIRDLDDACAKDLLSACDLLEENWGKWHFNAERGTVIFDDRETLSKYNAIVGSINGTAQQQGEAQKQFLKSMQ